MIFRVGLLIPYLLSSTTKRIGSCRSFGETNGLEEIALARGRIAHRGHDHVGFWSSLIPQAMPQPGRSCEPVGVGTLQMPRDA